MMDFPNEATTPEQIPSTYNSFRIDFYQHATIEDRRKILMHQAVEKVFIESGKIEDDVSFIYKLEEKKIISVSNVNPLLRCLEDLGMMNLAEIVKRYQSTITVEPDVESEQTEDNLGLTSFETCQHQEDTVRLLCVTCCMYVCYECTYHSHKTHEVYEEGEFRNGIEQYRRRIQDESREVHLMIESLEKAINAQRASERKKEIENEVESFAGDFRHNMKRQYKIASEKLSKQEALMKSAMAKTKEDMENLRSLGENISVRLQSTSSDNDLMRLQSINAFNNKIISGIKRAESISAKVVDMGACVRFLPSSLSAKFVTLAIGKIVGSVRINQNEVVIVTDQRHQDPPAILLSCVLCNNTTHLRWWYAIESDYIWETGNKSASIAVCNKLFSAPPHECILIGYGTRLFQVRIQKMEDHCLYSSSTYKDCKLEMGAEITCVNVLSSETFSAGVVITDSVSHSISRYNRDLEIEERISLKVRPRLVAGVFDKMFIYAYSDGKSVTVINGRSSEEVIHPPKSDQDLLPVNMFHDFAAFSVLWRSRQIEKNGQYKNKSIVTVLSSKGDMRRVSHEQQDDSSYAIGISYVKNNGLLCLSNGKVELYETL